MRIRQAIALPLLLTPALAAAPAQGQILPTDPLFQALTGRVGSLESRAANVDLSLAANVSALNNVQAQIAVDVTAIADLDARVTVNSNLIAANTLHDDVQDGRIGVLEGRADQNDIGDAARDAALAAANARNNTQDTRLGSVEARATAGDLRDDGQDAALAATATLNTAQDGRLTANETAIAANIARDDTQDIQIAAGVARDDAQDVRIAANATGIGTLRADIDAGRAGLVRQADPNGPVTVAAATGGTSVSFSGTSGDRRLSGVAAGVAANDAVNMGQLSASANATLASANAYTDRSMAALLDANERQLAANSGVLRRDLRAIASGTTAIAGLPQSFIPGKGMVGVSIGGTGGEAAVAVGLSKAFAGENPLVVRGGLAFDTRRGDATYNAAVGIHF